MSVNASNVFSDNVPARRLYESWGFAEDSVTMKKKTLRARRPARRTIAIAHACAPAAPVADDRFRVSAGLGRAIAVATKELPPAVHAARRRYRVIGTALRERPEAAAHGDTRELAHRGRSLLQSEIAEVARHRSAGLPPSRGHGPQIRQTSVPLPAGLRD